MAVGPDGPRSAAAPAPQLAESVPIASVRTFVAILLPPALRERLGAEIERLRPHAHGVGWVAPDNLHLTLKFLGGVEPARLPEIAAALEQVAGGGAPFELALHRVGAFPSATRPRVLWAGVSAGAPALGALAAQVEAALVGLGFPPEDRPFSAHVTLGRVREPRRDPRLAAALNAAGSGALGAFVVEQLALMRSDLSPRGARYSPLGSWSLGSG